MHITPFFPRHSRGVIAGLILASIGVVGQAQQPSPAASKANSDAFPRFESYIKITGQAPSVTGSDSAYARRFQAPASGAYGIEAFHYGKDVGEDAAVVFDGRALVGSEDYLAQMLFTKNEVGSFEAGFKSFRTFYDGIGGFFPVNNSFRQLGNPELHTDRAKFWATAKLARPDRPAFELSYVNDTRKGRKDTTVWGDTDFTGIPIWSQSSLNPVSANRKLIPSYLELDENQQTITALMQHTAGKTEYHFEVVYNTNETFDTRWVTRYPGELKPFPAIPSSPAVIIPPALANNPNYGPDSQMIDSNIWTYTGKFETTLSEKVSIYGGLSYQDANADIGGDRQIDVTFQTAVGPVGGVGGFTSGGRPAYSYKTVAGTTNETILTGNVGASFKPSTDWYLSLGFKAEKLEMDGSNAINFLATIVNQNTGSATLLTAPGPNYSERTEESYVPELNVRYTGIKDLSLYGTFDYRYSPGDERGTDSHVSSSGSAISVSTTAGAKAIELNHGHYKVGANWTVNPLLTLRGEFFYKDHRNSMIGYDMSAGDRFILGYAFEGAKFTAVVKPTAQLTFTTRYVHQAGQMDTTVDLGSSYDSMDSKNQMIGETIDWNPNKTMYMQANLNVVFASISTAYPRAGGTANDVIRNADNNYTNGNIVTGFVLAKNTDAKIEGSFYRADNYDPTVTATVPYGAGVKEYTVTVGVTHKFSDRLLMDIKLGYFESESETTGGNTNFKGPMGYLSFSRAL
jgi:hypothetical protein